MKKNGFTLIEILVSAAILVMILAFLFSTVNQASQIWRRSSDTIEAFQSARNAFDLMTRKISHATLNTYWDYEYTTIDGVQFPQAYRRESDLHFLCGIGLVGLSSAIFFQTNDGYTADPAAFGGMSRLLNDCGFYILYSDDTPWRPATASGLATNNRFRLIQMETPSEDMESIRQIASWFSASANPSDSDFATNNVPVGDNIIAIVFYPKHSSQEAAIDFPGGFSYDSREGATAASQPITANQLPPLVEIAMVAIDERSATRLAESSGASVPNEIANVLSDKLQIPANLDKDLQDIETALAEKNITARVFRTTVPVHASRWSDF